MDGLETNMFGSFDIGERVVDEQTFLRGSVDSFQREMKDRRIWLDEIMLARDDHVVEDLKEVVFFEKWNSTEDENWKEIQEMIKTNLEYA